MTGRLRRMVDALAARRPSGDPLAEHVRILDQELDTALAQRDQAFDERDRLVEVIAKLTGMPPAEVARAYQVRYSGPPAVDAAAFLDLEFARQSLRRAGGGRP